MADKIKKAPGIFAKPVRKEKWDKKFIKKIHLPEDRKFLESLLVEEEGRVRVNVEGLSKKEMKRLKALGKAIKKNRKSLNFILVFIVVVIVGGLVFFEFYLKNRLVQKLIETQLEKVFLAEVDTDGVNLNVFDGRFSLDYLAVADAGSPMFNLFECSSVTADLKTAELLQGRVFIEELGFADLETGTEREESGELPAEDPEPDSETSSVGESELVSESRNAVSDVINQIGVLSGEIDVEAIIERQKENLKSFAVIEESKLKVEGYAEEWKTRASEWEGRMDAWEDSVEYIVTVDAGSFQTLESAQSAITRIESIYRDAERDYTAVQSDFDAAGRQFNEAAVMYSSIEEAVALDYEYIEALVTIPAGDKVDWAASILEEQLSMPFRKYLSYLERGLEWYNRFKKMTELRKEKAPALRRPGRRLPPPADAPPGFVLVHAFASGEEPGVGYRLDLNNLASEPEKWTEQASLEIGLDTPSTGAAEAVITESSLDLEVPAAPFDLGGSLSALDISLFSGSLALGSGIGWDDEGFAGNFDLEAVELNLESNKPDGLLYRLVSTSLESVKPLTAVGNFTWSESAGFDISVETELDDSLGAAASAMLKEGADEGVQLLKDYLGARLAGPLEDFNSAKSEFGSYVDMIGNYEQEIDKYRSMADAKIAEIKQSAKDNAARQAEQLLKDAVPEDIIPDDAADALKSTLGSKLKF